MKKYIYAATGLLIILSLSFLFLYNYIVIILTLLLLATVSVMFCTHRSYSARENRYRQTIAGTQKKLDDFNSEVQVAASKIASVSQQLGITFEENNSFAADLFEQTKEMTDFNRGVASDIRNILDAEFKLMKIIEQSGQTSSQMTQIGMQSDTIITKNINSVLDVIKIIDEIRDSTDRTVLYMKKLEETSGQIISILESVEKISQQTNLLALNAAIESARAGTSGKGFAVVADEIGKLSVDTAESVKNIGFLISGIRSEISDVSGVINTNTENVGRGVQMSRNIESGLGQIREFSGGVVSMINDLDEKMSNELRLGSEIETMAGEIESLIKHAERSIVSVYSSVQKQKQNMTELSGMNRHLSVASDSLIGLLGTSQDIHGRDYVTSELKEKIARVFDIISSEVMTDPAIRTTDPGRQRLMLDRLIKKYSFIEAAWTNDSRGRFIVSIPDAGIANAGVREWFKKSIAGEKYVSGVYISAITKNPCITVSQPIKENGNITGVAGFDIRLV